MKNEERKMKNEEFCCAMIAFRMVILHSSFFIKLGLPENINHEPHLCRCIASASPVHACV